MALDSEGSVFKLKTGRQAGKWRAELVVGWTRDSKKVTRTRTCETKKAAQAALRDLANERDAGGNVNRGARNTEPLFGDWCTDWLKRHARDSQIEASTVHSYGTALRTWIIPHAGGKRLSAVTAATIRGVLDAIGDRQSTKQKAWIVMHAALEDAARQKLITRSPAADLKPPKQKRTEIHPPMDEDVEAIYRAIAGEPDEVRWLLALTLGIRQGEMLGLEWSAIDLEAQTLTVTQQLVRVRGVHGCGEPKRKGEHQGNEWPCGRTWASKCPQGTPGGLVLKKVKTVKGNRTLPLLPVMVPMLKALAKQQQKDAMRPGVKYQQMKVKDGRRTRTTDLVFRGPQGPGTGPADGLRQLARRHQACRAGPLPPPRRPPLRRRRPAGFGDADRAPCRHPRPRVRELLA
jgi:integrase